SLSLSPAAALTHIYTLSLHDALPISSRPAPSSGLPLGPRLTAKRADAPQPRRVQRGRLRRSRRRPRRAQGCLREVTGPATGPSRSEEHTSELQSRFDLVCRLLLEKKK